MNLSWNFKEVGGLILGRTSEGKGVLQISTAFKSDFSPKATSEEAGNSLREFAGLVGSGVKINISETNPIEYGYLDLIKNEQMARYWYLIKPEGLIIATYVTRNSAFDERELQDCELILLNNNF